MFFIQFYSFDGQWRWRTFSNRLVRRLINHSQQHDPEPDLLTEQEIDQALTQIQKTDPKVRFRKVSAFQVNRDDGFVTSWMPNP